jgi:mannose-1-phosphate guanylyltransferase
MYYALIMAGGSGTRLWPFSRRDHPKQALKLIGERTMMQHAVDRLAPLFVPEHIFVVTQSKCVPMLVGQVPELPAENFIREPLARGTAAAIGLGTIHLHRRDPDAIMAVLTADHFITNTERFRAGLAAASKMAEEGYLVTLGIKPLAPATGLGYIKQGNDLGEPDGYPAFSVVEFVEKPDQDAANQMVASGGYSWNSGMFIWRADRIMEEFQKQMPPLYAQLMELEAVLGTPEAEATINRVWPQINKQTIDYGVMEHAERVAVIPVDIGWSDIGSWSSLAGLLPGDNARNTVVGRHVSVDTYNTLIVSDNEKRLIASVGLNNMVIVSMDDAVLVCAKEREQDVRQIVKQLETGGHDDWL